MSEDKNFSKWNGSDNEESALQLSDILAMFTSHKWAYVIFTALCLFIALFYLYRTPKTWSRTAKVIVDESAENSTLRDLASFSASSARSRYYASSANVYNEMEAFSSPDIMQKVVERLGLETSYVEDQFLRKRELYTGTPFVMVLAGDNPTSSLSFRVVKKSGESFLLDEFAVAGQPIKGKSVQGAMGDTLVTPVGRLALMPTIHADKWSNDITVLWANSMSRAKSYAGRLHVSLSGKETSVVVLSIEDLFPARAQSVISTLIDIYNEQWIQNQTRAARNTTAFIDDRLKVINAELGGVEDDLREYKEANKITNIQSISDSYLAESSQYQSRAFEVNNQLSIARFIKSYLNDPKHERDLIPSNSGLTNVGVESSIQEYNALVLKRDNLLRDAGTNNPLIIDLNNSIDAMKVSINRSIDNLIAALKLQADDISARENEILNRIANTSGQELQLLSIERQQKVTESLYVYLLQKREENEIASLVNVANTRTIMNPNGGSAPVAPNKKLVLLIALMMGLGIPFAYYFLKNSLETSVKTKADLASLSAPFLAEIPQMGIPENFWEKLRLNKYNDDNCKIQVKSGKRDAINEAFRVLRTNLDVMASQEKGQSHVFMVTSFNPNAGKTFTIMNMAASMALKGTRVLLLDLDLRKATLSKALRKNSTGSAAYLTGKIDDYHSVVQKLEDNLSLLSVGTLPPNPAEILVSDKFKDFMEQLRTEYDNIFIDCPPVDVVADTSIIARHADITVFILRAGLFDRRALPAVEDLYNKGMYNRMAIVLNGVMGSGSHYGHYGYGYGYGYGEQDTPSGKSRKKSTKKSSFDSDPGNTGDVIKSA